MSEVRKILTKAMRLASQSKDGEALEELERGLKESKKGGDNEGAAILARNAALICERMGKLRKATQYYEASLKLNPQASIAWLALGSLYSRQGKKAKAQSFLKAGYELATKQHDAEMLEVFERAGFRRGDKSPGV